MLADRIDIGAVVGAEVVMDVVFLILVGCVGVGSLGFGFALGLLGGDGSFSLFLELVEAGFASKLAHDAEIVVGLEAAGFESDDQRMSLGGSVMRALAYSPWPQAPMFALCPRWRVMGGVLNVVSDAER
jgi:hypothetical protein